MLLLLVYWGYLGFTFVNLGFGFQKITRLKSTEIIFTIIFGMLTTTILASVWAIFGRINFEFQLFLLAIQFVLIVGFRKELASIYKDFWNQLKTLPQKLQTLLSLTLLLTLLYGVSGASFNDNETYYVQTIKWLNEYGLVKGLANLHLFFGQTSGWHILQSAFSFSYLSDRLNQLNGFCLLLGNVYAVFRLNDYFKNANRQYSWIGLLPAANVVLFVFGQVPSPDLAVMIFSLIAFDFFIQQYKTEDNVSFNVLFLLSIFIVYIKITALPILLLPLFFLIINFKKILSKITLSLLMGLMMLFLFVIKNSILSGYPLFPSTLSKDYYKVDYAIPAALYDFSFDRAHCYSFFISGNDFGTSNAGQIFVKWLLYSGVNSILNTMIVISMLLMPYFIKRYFNQRNFWILYAAMVLQFALLWYGSPQYRFMLPYLLLFGLITFSIFVKSMPSIYNLCFGSLVLAFCFLLFPFQLGNHQQKLHFNKQPISISQLVYPHKNSNLKTEYQEHQIGNLRYFSPDTSVYIWATGNGKLPCVNAKQIEYFDKKLHYIPQLRTSNIQDGFYSQKTTHP